MPNRVYPMEGFDALTAWTGHVLSGAAIAGTLIGLFPPVAAFAAFVWYTIQIYESRTFQHWYRNLQLKNRARHLSKLRAQEKIVLAKIDAIEKVRVAYAEARETLATARVDAAKLAVQDEAELKKTLPPI